MKIAIISDTHDNLANIKKVVDWLNKEKINLILHCGDVSSQNSLNEMNKLFRGKIKVVRGNADVDLIDIPDIDEVELGGKKIAFTHYFETAKKLAEGGNPSAGSGQRYNIVFYGHTHRPWEEKVGDCRLINPGEVAGQFFKPTFAVYETDTDKLELKILEKLEG